MVIEPGSFGKNGVQGSGVSTQRVKSGYADAAESQKSSGAPQDSVSLSQQAKSMGKLESKVAQAADVDLAKVEAIKQSLANGSYVVDSGSIAGKMLSEDGLL